MKETILGKSVNGKDIKGYSFGDEDAFNKTLIIGGIHGNEPQSAKICYLYLEDIKDKSFLDDAYLLVIPKINPDGIEKRIRTNARGVDLNRNFPSNTWAKVKFAKGDQYYPGVKPVSEPETKIIVDLLKKYNFKKVISIHTNAVVKNPHPPMINYDSQQGKELAYKLAYATKLIAKDDIGYSTPGSLGTWVGKDLRKISITVELDSEMKSEELYEKYGMFFEMCVQYI